MTLEQLCNLFNVVAVVIPTVFSGGLTLTHRAAYFRSWTLSLALCALTLILETYTQGIGHAIAPTAVEVALYLASACYSFKMAAQVAGRDGRTTLYVGVAAGTFALYLGLSLAGKPFELAFMPAILYLLASQLVLGTRMIRGGGPLAMARAALGWLLIVTALWVLTYPAAVALHLVAAGFIVSGILHLVLGMGMLLLLLAEIAAGLERKNEELRAVERLQAEFIGTMNHEFRTPLNAIKTAAWLLGNSGEVDRLSARQRETVEIVSLNAERVIGLVNDVLDFSKIESGTMSYEFEVTDLNQLLERVARSLNQLFESKEIDLVLELPPEAVVADVDAQRIEQVINNLLSNALKFTHR
ncbi:MAG: histidine kinase, partial [Cyanobacteria bacterium RYN_339]|nr:histidine kinase [Cyanobacteria bacterium RYN_339]